MDSEAFESAARDLLDLNFQSLAMKHIDLKQMELDTAAAKVDELTKQLESLWSDSPAPSTPPPQASAPTRLTRYSSSPTPDHFSRTSSPRKVADGGDAAYTRSENSPALLPYSPLSPKGRPSSPRTPLYLSSESYSSLERAPSPRPKTMTYEAVVGSLGRAPSPRPGSGSLRPTGPPPQYDFLVGGRAGSPRGDGPQAFFPDHRGPSPRLGLPATYEGSAVFGSPPPGAGGSAFAPLRAQDDLTLRRRPPKSWNESDLDVAYEKKSSSQPSSYDRLDVFGGLRPSSPSLQLLPWRESSLDGLGGPGKDGLTSSTLPRNYKVSPLASDRRTEASGYRRSLGPGVPGTLPRSWQPASRIAMPPTSPQARGTPRQRPIPLSMIFKLQNAFWEYGAAKAGPPGSPIITRAPLPKLSPQVPAPGPALQSPVPAPQSPVPAPQSPAQPPATQLAPPARPTGGEGPPKPPEEPEPEPELEGLLAPTLEVVETEEGAVPRPLSPTRLQPALPPEAQTVPELEEVARVLAEIPRPLKRRGSMEQSPGPALPPTHKKQYQQIINRLFHRHGGSGGGGGSPPRDGGTGPGGPEPELPPITEGSDARAGPPAPAPPAPALAPSLPDPPPPQSTEMRSVLRKGGSPRKARRARLNPLVLLLDAALTGELDVVQQAVKEINDPSQPNEEGITALHNAICGANYAIVDFLIGTGANVNSPDSHGWTPLHCAASCNDTAICTALVQHGAAIFATTLSDGAMAIEKCDPYREGYADCATYLAEAEQSMGHLHGGAVYALWDYSAEFGDELSFREGEPVTVLRRDGPEETDWWWAALRGQEGYVPRNYFGLFPRVKPQRGKV
ncbi:relA-associated inhibitor isoform X1 [Phascolarctos cinereus]|nr:relA-associated inhibitor isoform X1 [Phascolarctos cinereus]XP_020835774.1 relA-associated inhibitor isoform X1 [Phascolarctos cinereus]XP_020835775.1 relA-associated inhibitor isoform X1 [Phascolarctos cinereus]XP_020835776.1 relA-associated inhibitor isoform X1 [Phascolarctos cinereus]XP_020835777.1 relA-associated inhibitor isoform X1 [Phascolarctos cinereus]